jgi:hypothetical protein
VLEKFCRQQKLSSAGHQLLITVVVFENTKVKEEG